MDIPQVNDLDELQRRKATRPLIVLGAVLPILLLTVVGVFAWRCFNSAMQGSEKALVDSAQEMHRLACDYAALAIAHKIQRRWGTLVNAGDELMATDRFMIQPPRRIERKERVPFGHEQKIRSELRAKAELAFKNTWGLDRKNDEMDILVAALNWAKTQLKREFAAATNAKEKIDKRLDAEPEYLLGYVDNISDPDPKRQQEKRAEARRMLEGWLALEKWLSSLNREFRDEFSTASWFITNDRGVQIARAPLDSETLFGEFWERDYFHGQGRNLDENEHENKIPQPIHNPYLSQVFQSKATGRPVVTFSVPIWDSEPDQTRAKGVAGVLAMTVEFGDFSELDRDNKNVITVLVDGRPDENETPGLILEHPFLSELQERQETLPKPFYLDGEIRDRVIMLAMPKAHYERITAEEERELSLTLGEQQPDYIDPIAEHNPEYRGKLLGVAKPVMVFGRRTGWAVIVQQKRDNILEPVYSLSGQLQRQALAATVFVLIALAAVWGFVLLTCSAIAARGSSPPCGSGSG
jgi:hypothetical protein